MPDAPRFPYPVWAVWRDDLDPEVKAVAVQVLSQVADAAEADGDAVLEQLRDISDDEDIDILGKSIELPHT